MCLTCVLRVSYLCLTCVLHVSYMCLTCVLPVSYLCMTQNKQLVTKIEPNHDRRPSDSKNAQAGSTAEPALRTRFKEGDCGTVAKRTSQLREYIARRQCTTSGIKKRIRSYSPRTYPDRICATPEAGCARSRATPEGQNPPAMMRMFAKSIPFDGRNSRCVTTDHSRSWQAETNRTKKIHCFGPSTSSSGTRRFRKI